MRGGSGRLLLWQFRGWAKRLLVRHRSFGLLRCGGRCLLLWWLRVLLPVGPGHDPVPPPLPDLLYAHRIIIMRIGKSILDDCKLHILPDDRESIVMDASPIGCSIPMPILSIHINSCSLYTWSRISLPSPFTQPRSPSILFQFPTTESYCPLTLLFLPSMQWLSPWTVFEESIIFVFGAMYVVMNGDGAGQNEGIFAAIGCNWFGKLKNVGMGIEGCWGGN